MNKEHLYTKYNFTLEEVITLKKLYKKDLNKIEAFVDTLPYEQQIKLFNILKFTKDKLGI